MENPVWPFLGCMFGALALTLLVAWMTTQFRYQITSTHLQVVLFGIPLRRISLKDIESVSRHGSTWGEHWWNTYNSFRRILIIRRRSGLMKNFIITPLHRYVFRADLEKAIAATHSEVYHPVADGETESSAS